MSMDVYRYVRVFILGMYGGLWVFMIVYGCSGVLWRFMGIYGC